MILCLVELVTGCATNGYWGGLSLTLLEDRSLTVITFEILVTIPTTHRIFPHIIIRLMLLGCIRDHTGVGHTRGGGKRCS